MMTTDDELYLKAVFADILNFQSDDLFDPIDPITYLNPEGDSCLHIAVIRGDFRAVKLLLVLGLNINQRGDMGSTALHYAISFKHAEIQQLLIRSGADTTLIDDFGNSAISKSI